MIRFHELETVRTELRLVHRMTGNQMFEYDSPQSDKLNLGKTLQVTRSYMTLEA